MKVINTNIKTIISNFSCKLAKRPLLFPAAIVVLSAYFAVLFFNIIPIIVAILLCVLLLFVKEVKKICFSIGLSLILLTYLLFLFFGVFSTFQTDSVYDAAFEAKVVSVSRKLDGSNSIILDSKKYGRMIINNYSNEEMLNIDDFLQVEGNLIIPSSPSNPGEFDYKSYLKKQGISTVLYCNKIEVINKSKIGEKVGEISSFFFSLKCIAADCYVQEKGLAASFFLGDTSLIDSTERSIFNKAGCSHLLAVSGTHFAGFLALIPFLFEKLNLKNRTSLLIYILFCVFIGCLTGWSASVTRAAVMSIMAFAHKDAVSGMSLASICIVVANPFSSISQGFLMSFSCAVAIRFFSRKVSRAVARLDLGNKLSDSIGILIASQIGIIPFWSTTGAYVSLLNFPVQLIESFLASIACAIFIPCTLLSIVFSDVFSMPVIIMIHLIRKIAIIFNSIPVYSFNSKSLGSFVVFSLYLFLFLLLLEPCILRRKLITSSFLLVAVSFGLLLSNMCFGPEAVVVFIDVGQGDSCLIISGGESVLIDGGVYEEGKTVAAVLDYYSIDKVDVACFTHWDQDHAGGIAALYNSGRINKLCTSYVENSSDITDFINQYFEKVDNVERFLESIETIRCGDIINVGNSTHLECISPQNPTDGGNEDSLVFNLISNGFSCLLTGDIGFETETVLLSEGLIDEYSMLKVAHHGSKYSTGRELLECINAQYALISVGRYNNYGHPTEEVLDKLDEFGIETLITRDTGAVSVYVYKYRFVITEQL